MPPLLLTLLLLLLPLQRPRATPITGTLGSTPATPTFEASYTLTATLTGSPTGTITFSLEGTAPVTVALTGASTTTSIPAYSQGSPTPPILPGDHTLTALYSGDATYAPTTLTDTLTIARGPTSVTLTPTTPIPTPYGGPVDGTFAVNVLDPHYPATGTYTLFDNDAAVPECTNLPLTAVCPYGDPQILDAGPHALAVAYNGDPVNAPSISDAITFTVTPDTVTAATLTSNPNPATLGSPVTFTATLTGSAATPSGQVQFTDSGILLGTAPLNASGIATFISSSLALGTHPIQAVFLATPDFSAATSTTVQQVIVPPVTPGSGFTLTVTPTPVTVSVGGIATLTVTVKQTGSFSQPIQLSCSGLPDQSTCTFANPLIPAGGGSTTLLLATASPHDCNSTTPYLPVTTSVDPAAAPALASRYPKASALGLSSPFWSGALAPGVCLLFTGSLFLRRRRRLPTLFFLATLAVLTTLTACGHCTNLGTSPGSYTVTVIGIAQQGTALTQSQTIPLKVTLQ